MTANFEDLTRDSGPVTAVDLRADRAVVKLLHDIDMNCSPEVRVVLMELTTRKVPVIGVDLSDVPYMDSSGLATLIETLHRVQKYKGQLVLFGLQQRVRSVFEIANLTKIFNIQADSAGAFGNG